MLTLLVLLGVAAVILQGIIITLLLLWRQSFGQFTESVLLLHEALLGLFSDSVRHRLIQDRRDAERAEERAPAPAPFTSEENVA